MNIIRDALVESGVRHLFSTPSKKIDRIVEEICSGSLVQLVSCISESNAIDSCLSYHLVSGKVSAVLIDSEFIPADFLNKVEKSKSLESKVIFIFVGPVDKYFGKAIEESGLILKVSDITQSVNFNLQSGPRIVLFSSKKAKLPHNSADLSLEISVPESVGRGEQESDISLDGLRFALYLIDELLTHSPDSIVIPDAGSARKIVLSKLSKSNYVTTSGLTAMGWSLKALRGINLGSPDRLPIVVIGDGSLLLCASELALLANSRTSCVVILLINGQLGNRAEDTFIGKSSKLPKVDWQMFVEALGAQYVPIKSWPRRDFAERLLRKTQDELQPVVVPVDISLETAYIYTWKSGLSVLDQA